MLITINTIVISGNSMGIEEILLERGDGVATLIFNRPRARNAMNPAMRDALMDALDALASDDGVRAVVLRGQGGNFVAGGDLQAFAATLELDREARRENFRERVKISSGLVSRLVYFPKPLVAAIEGDAAGAGISIALCCDFVLATEKSRFSFAHAHVGLALDLGLSYFLPRAAGSMQARRLAMLGAQIAASEAHGLGLVTTVVEENQLEDELNQLLASLQKMPGSALAAIKREFRVTGNATLEEQLALEAEAVADCAANESFEKRVAAFLGAEEK